MTAASAELPDYTKGPIGKAILALSVPMVLEMLMESVFAVVDVYFVGKLGAEAVATIGITESIMSLVYTVAMGLAIGAAAVTARRTGEGDPDGAAMATVQSLLLGFVLSILIGVFGVIYTDDLYRLMGASESLIEHGRAYMQIMLGGNAAVLLLFLANAAFRGVGDAWIAMRSLWIANGFNLVLCPLLVFGIDGFVPAYGVTGAGIATTVARATGAVYVLWKMADGKGRLKVEKKHFKPVWDVMSGIAKLSLSGMFQMFIATASWIGLTRVVSNFGEDALAGYTIGLRLIVFAFMPAYGLGNAAATMVGQSLGALDPQRAEKSVWIASFYGAVFLGVIGVLFIAFAHPIVALFTQDPGVHEYAVHCLRVLSAGFPMFAYGMTLTQAFNGAGDTWTPTWINFGVFWVFEIPFAYVMSTNFGMGPDGVFYAVTIAFAFLAVVSGVLFKQGRWKQQLV